MHRVKQTLPCVLLHCKIFLCGVGGKKFKIKKKNAHGCCIDSADDHLSSSTFQFQRRRPGHFPLPPLCNLEVTLKPFFNLFCVNVGAHRLLIIVAIPLHLQRLSWKEDQGHSRASPPHFKHHKPPRLLPLLMKQQLMCIWGRLIVTGFTAACNVPLMV